MKALLYFLKERLLYPFQKDLIFFFLLWMLFALPNCYSQRNNIVYVAYLAMMYYIIAYIVVVVIDSIEIVAKVLKPILLVASTLICLINLYCVCTYGCLLSNDFIQIIAGTNIEEASEFFATFISWKDVFLFLLIFTISIAMAVRLPRTQRIKLGKTWIVTSGFLLVSIGAICHNSGIIKEEFVDKGRWNFSFDEVVDLRQHLTHPKIEENDSIHPKQIVIILGEAFSSNHSSLYGYNKITNPLLAKQEEEGNLLVFENVISPCTITTLTFKYLLNTYLVNCEDGKAWYEHTNIIEVMNAAGYYTAWISNQAETGMYDNLPSGHAKLCNESIFLRRQNNVNDYDGSLINMKISHNHEKNCIFYHLMGQHEKFDARYPKEYDKFEANDYMSFPTHQRKILASYDNATLYNDFVVNSIMELYKGQDAVVFYLPDHALDIFDTDPDYFGHAKMTEASQAQGKKIPFMIYVSPVFKKLHSEKYERMRYTDNLPFCTDKLIYTVMDVAGFRFADNNDVDRYSLFQEGNLSK